MSLESRIYQRVDDDTTWVGLEGILQDLKSAAASGQG